MVYSGIMTQELKKPEAYCVGINKKGIEVDTTAKWLIMAKLCFSTSLIIVVTNIGAAVASCFGPESAGVKLCKYLNSMTSCPFIANCFVIPFTIFAAYSKPCYEMLDPITGLETKTGPLASEFKGFKIIWILMLALSISLAILGFLIMCIVGCVVARAAAK